MMEHTSEFLDRESDPGKRQGGTIVPGTPRSWAKPESRDGQSGSCPAGEPVANASAKDATQPSVSTTGQPGTSGTAPAQSSDALPTSASVSSTAIVEAPRPGPLRDSSLGSIPLAVRMAQLRGAGLTDAALDARLPSSASSRTDDPPPGSVREDPLLSAHDALLHFEHQEGWDCAFTVATHTTGSGVGERTISPARSSSTEMSVDPPLQPLVDASSESEVSPVITRNTATKRKKNADQFRRRDASNRRMQQDRGAAPTKRRRKQRDVESSDEEPSELPPAVPLHAAPVTVTKPSRLHLRKERAIANELADFAGRSLQAVGADMLTWVAEVEEMRRACTNLPGEGVQGGISGRVSGRMRDRLLRLKIGLQAVCTSNPADAVSAEVAYTRMQAKQDVARLHELEVQIKAVTEEAARARLLEADNRFLREELHRRSAELRQQRRALPPLASGTQTSPLPLPVAVGRSASGPGPQSPGGRTPPRPPFAPLSPLASVAEVGAVSPQRGSAFVTFDGGVY